MFGELVGADTDSERAIRPLIALMVLCYDPLALARTAAASARRIAAWQSLPAKYLVAVGSAQISRLEANGRAACCSQQKIALAKQKLGTALIKNYS
jgi:hypothetical protein